MKGLRIVVKTSILFIVLNLIVALLNPLNFIGQLSIYNWLVPGRERLPYGEDQQAYNLSLNNLSAMFASHRLAQPKAPDEYRVIIMGDSSTWGILLKPDETLAAYINAADLQVGDNQHVVAYNLGHPVLSLTKDLLLLDSARQYEPDLMIWPVTLRSFPRDKQFAAPLVQNNATAVRRLFRTYNLDYDLTDARLVDPTLLDRTIVGQRRALADWLRLQFYGVMWAITTIDQFYPDEITLRTSDFAVDTAWDDILEPQPITAEDLSFDIVRAGFDHAGAIPLLLVNEPIFISSGENSDLRYNLWYPRWAYDAYRDLLRIEATNANWNYVDLWNYIDAAEFTDSPVHLTPTGSRQMATRLTHEIERLAKGSDING